MQPDEAAAKGSPHSDFDGHRQQQAVLWKGAEQHGKDGWGQADVLLAHVHNRNCPGTHLRGAKDDSCMMLHLSFYTSSQVLKYSEEQASSAFVILVLLYHAQQTLRFVVSDGFHDSSMSFANFSPSCVNCSHSLCGQLFRLIRRRRELQRTTDWHIMCDTIVIYCSVRSDIRMIMYVL